MHGERGGQIRMNALIAYVEDVAIKNDRVMKKYDVLVWAADQDDEPLF